MVMAVERRGDRAKVSTTVAVPRWRDLWGSALLCCALLVVSAPSLAQTEETSSVAAQAERDAILLNFESADIREVIYTFAAALELNYWIDPRVQGQVTARSFGPIYIDDLFPVFLQILQSNGYAAVREGELYMIVPAEDGKKRANLAALSGGEQVVVDLVKLSHVDAGKIVEMLNPFVSNGGDVVAYPRNNLVVITDLASNALRLRDLIKTFDTDTFRDMDGRVYKIEHAALEDLSEELLSILDSYQVVDSGAKVQLIPLVRLNSLAVIGFDPAVFASIEHWLKILDVPDVGGTERRVFVYHVENSKAVDLAEVLNEVYQGLAEGDSQGPRRGRSGALAERGLGLGGGIDQARRGQQGRQQAGQRNPQQQQRVRQASQVLSGAAAEQQGLSGTLFEQEIRIVADELTNSLVVLATPRDYQAIKAVLGELDLVPRQVLVEMLIAEITLSDDIDLGITHKIGNTTTNTLGSGGTSPATTAPPTGTGAVLARSLFGKNAKSEGFRLDGTFGPPGIQAVLSWFGGDYTAAINALAQTSEIKVLSRPHILTADNQEARILIGNEIPIVTSQSDSASTSDAVFRQNVEYRDTGVVVSVTPQVNSDGLVNMIVSQEVSDVATAAQIAGIVSPSFSTREAETTVVVQSGETIVIGGIISETNSEGKAGIPYLMDIPVLGQIFRSRSAKKRRTELIILITPYVVRTRNEARTVTEEFKARVDDVLHELKLDEASTGGDGHTLILGSPAS